MPGSSLNRKWKSDALMRLSMLAGMLAVMLFSGSLLVSSARAAPGMQQQPGYWQFTGTNTSDTFNESWGPGSSWYPSPDDWSGGGTIDYVSGSNQIQITTDCAWSLSGGEGGTQNLAPGATVSVSVSVNSSADGRSDIANIAAQDSVNAYGFGTNIAHAQDDYSIANGGSDSASSSGSGSLTVPTGSTGATQSLVFTCMVNAGMGITRTEWFYQWVESPAPNPAPAPGGSNPPPAPPSGGEPPVQDPGNSPAPNGNKGLAGGLAAGGAVAGALGAAATAAGVAGAVAGSNAGAASGTTGGTSTGTAAGSSTSPASGSPALAPSLQNLANDLDVINKNLTSQGIYVANKFQGDPVLVFQGIEVLGNAIWDKTGGRITGAQGFTCGDYVNKTLADVKAAVAKNFPGAKVQRVEYDEMSSLNAAGPNPSISDRLDALNAENHTLIKVTLPNNQGEYAIDFHQHNASNIQTNPPIMRPYKQVRAEWQKYLGQNEFVETVK